MAKNSKKTSFNWSYVGLVVLLILIIVQFIQINNLDSAKLKSEITKVENKLTNEQKQLNNNVKSLEQKLNDLPNDKSENNPKSEFPWIWVVSLSVVAIVLIAVIVWIVFFSKEYIKKVVDESRRLEDKFVLKKDYQNRSTLVAVQDKPATNDIENTINKLLKNESFINSIAQKVKEGLPTNNETRVDDEIIKTQITQYLKGKSGHTFSNTSEISDGSFFKLVNEKDGIAEFEYCGTIEDARSQFNAIFDNVCDTEGSAQNAKTVKTVKRGKIKLSDGKWDVTEKAKIKFD